MDLTVAIAVADTDPGLFGTVVERAAAEAPVVIVDMSATPALEAVAARPGVHYHHWPGSSGVSASRNECLRRVSSRFVLFLDSDAIPRPGWAAAMRAGLEQPRVAMVGARVLSGYPLPGLFDAATARDWLSLFDLGPEPREVPRVMGTSYALDLERVGDDPFDEGLGRMPGSQLGHEEVQLALDVQAAGWRCWYAGDAIVEHHFAPDRLTWGSMFQRAFTAGRETSLHSTQRLAALPREAGWRDHAFRAIVGPAFFAGRLAQRAR